MKKIKRERERLFPGWRPSLLLKRSIKRKVVTDTRDEKRSYHMLSPNLWILSLISPWNWKSERDRTGLPVYVYIQIVVSRLMTLHRRKLVKRGSKRSMAHFLHWEALFFFWSRPNNLGTVNVSRTSISFLLIFHHVSHILWLFITMIEPSRVTFSLLLDPLSLSESAGCLLKLIDKAIPEEENGEMERSCWLKLVFITD